MWRAGGCVSPLQFVALRQAAESGSRDHIAQVTSST